MVLPAEDWFSAIHLLMCILAFSLIDGSAAVIMTAFPPPAATSLSKLTCAPVSEAIFLMVAPAGPIILPTKAGGQIILLSTTPPGPPPGAPPGGAIMPPGGGGIAA